MPKAVTYETPEGSRITITPKAESVFTEAGLWPKDSMGREYCNIYRGLANVGIADFNKNRAVEYVKRIRPCPTVHLNGTAGPKPGKFPTSTRTGPML